MSSGETDLVNWSRSGLIIGTIRTAKPGTVPRRYILQKLFLVGKLSILILPIMCLLRWPEIMEVQESLVSLFCPLGQLEVQHLYLQLSRIPDKF